MSMIIPVKVKNLGDELQNFRPKPIPSTSGAGKDANTIDNFLHDIERHKTARKLPSSKRSTEKSMAEQLYDALATAKLLTSQVAMHIDQDWREWLFSHLDDLLDVDYWHEDDIPMKGASFATLLRLMLHQQIEKQPSFGVSHKGNLIAAWTSNGDRLTLEFLSDDFVRRVLSCVIDDETERAAGITPVRRLPKVIDSFRPERWFADAN